MRLPDRAHSTRPWRIREIVDGFELEDVWAVRTAAAADEFARFIELGVSYDPAQSRSPILRALFAARWKLGAVFGWDEPDAGSGTRVPTLRDRLPDDLRDAPTGPAIDATPFTPLYLLDDEWAAEIANATVHGVLHVGWVVNDTGSYDAQVAVYVEPNGRLGRAYMAAITPFRYLLVYPLMLSEWERRWQTRDRAPATADRIAPIPARAVSVGDARTPPPGGSAQRQMAEPPSRRTGDAAVISDAHDAPSVRCAVGPCP